MTLHEKVEIILTTDLKDIRNWFKFHAADWLTSLRLRACDPGARSLLIDLMAYTWDTGNPGIITLEDFFLMADTYKYDYDDTHLWLKQLSDAARSPLSVMSINGLMLVLIPRLIDIAVESILARKSAKNRGRLGGMKSGLAVQISGSEVQIGGSDGSDTGDKKYIESGLNRVKVNSLDPQLNFGGSELSSSDKRREEKKREEEITEQSTSRRTKKKRFPDYSEGFLKWYHGIGVEGYEGYPNKSGKRKAFGYWLEYGLESRTEEIIENTMRQIVERKLVMKSDPGVFLRGWQMAKTYINNESWEDSFLTPEIMDKRRKAEERKKNRKLTAYFPEDGSTKYFKDETSLRQYAEQEGYNVSLLDGEYRLRRDDDD